MEGQSDRGEGDGERADIVSVSLRLFRHQYPLSPTVPLTSSPEAVPRDTDREVTGERRETEAERYGLRGTREGEFTLCLR